MPTIEDRTPVIEVFGLWKNYKDVQALEDLSLKVYPGEIFGLIGPDGAGKSTLIHLIAGVLSAKKGNVRVLGKDVFRRPESIKTSIGFLPQGLGLALAGELSAEENINFFAEINHVEPKRREAMKAVLLEKTQLGPFKERQAKNLSGGMKQKLALCCTLIHQPQLLLLDEPTTGVDPISRRDIWTLINSMVRERNITVFLTTSYMDEAARCHRIALLHRGKIVEEGRPDLLPLKLEGKSAEGESADIEDVFLSKLAPEMEEVDERAIEDFFGAGPQAPKKEKEGAIMISAGALEKKFGNFVAVNKISFMVKRGEIFGFLGPNGAGKTTTIKMLCGLFSPTSGTGTIAGLDLFRQQFEIKKSIGYMSQKFSLYRDLTVSENIELYAGIYGVPPREVARRRELILKIADLQGKGGMITGGLPMGIKQRLALGCAIIHKPECIFLDEPTSGVDPIARRKFWDIINLLSMRMGVTVLVTTHYMDEAEHCDRILLINKGSVVALGEPEELKERVHEEIGVLFELSTSDPFSAVEALKKSFTPCHIYGANVHLYTKNEDEALPQIKEILEAREIILKDMRKKMIPFEDVFVYFCEKLVPSEALSLSKDEVEGQG